MSIAARQAIGVCMLTGVFYPEISGGSLQCRTLINSLKNKGIDFFVLTTTRNCSLKDDPSSNTNITRIVIKKMDLFSKIRAFLQFTNAFLKLERLIDIVHLHGFSGKTMLIILLARIFKKKIIQKITSFGDDDPRSISHKRFGSIQRRLFDKADIFISVNPVISQSCADNGIPVSKIAEIPNAVDTEKFSPSDPGQKGAVRKELGLPTEGNIVLFVGFFSEDKGPHILFEAWKKLRSAVHQKNTKLVFIGSTDPAYFEIRPGLVKKIKDDIKICGMEKEVFFIKKTLEIDKYYKASDIFVLPSLREGLPNALMEAMSSGLPCISSDLRGVTGYLISDKKEGLISPPGDAEALCNSMRLFFDNPGMAAELGRAARKKIIDEFSIDKVSERYLHLYVKLAGAGSAKKIDL